VRACSLLPRRIRLTQRTTGGTGHAEVPGADYPYITVSLIVGLARLCYAETKYLTVKAGAVLLLIWVCGLALILAVPLASSRLFFSGAVPRERKFLLAGRC
jgi:hypothetical protein